MQIPRGIPRLPVLSVMLALAACAQTATRQEVAPQDAPAINTESALSGGKVDLVKLVNRISWGVTSASLRHAQAVGAERYLEEQLHPVAEAALPPAVQVQIDALTISQRPVTDLAVEMERQRKDSEALANDDEKKAAKRAYQQEMNRLGREAATRSLLRDLYSTNQLQEQLTWFWMNHFNVHLYKANLRVTVGDFENRAIRPHVLGHFRDLLRATMFHPAMLTYLDNAQNAVGHINENYARELMELHTMGVGSGYTQHDVQELARVLTGMGVDYRGVPPRMRPAQQAKAVEDGLFVFNPKRHDFGDKVFLGSTIKGRGIAEVDEVIDRLARSPATAHFISRQLATYFVGDTPSPALVEQMAQTYLHTDGDIADVLHTLFESRAFVQSLDKDFKDPVHYVVSSVRMAYEDKPILNATPMINWLNRMGEPLYGHQTPDGYPLLDTAWSGPGQMATRFEIAKAIGTGNAGLFRSEGAQPVERPAFPQLASALYYQALQKGLSPATHQVLDQATSPQEWNTFFLASPEMMRR